MPAPPSTSTDCGTSSRSTDAPAEALRGHRPRPGGEVRFAGRAPNTLSSSGASAAASMLPTMAIFEPSRAKDAAAIGLEIVARDRRHALQRALGPGARRDGRGTPPPTSAGRRCRSGWSISRRIVEQRSARARARPARRRSAASVRRAAAGRTPRPGARPACAAAARWSRPTLKRSSIALASSRSWKAARRGRPRPRRAARTPCWRRRACRRDPGRRRRGRRTPARSAEPAARAPATPRSPPGETTRSMVVAAAGSAMRGERAATSGEQAA